MYLKLYRHTKKILMIKINVFVIEKKWSKYILSSKDFFYKKTELLDNYISYLRKKNFSFSLRLAGNYEIKNLNRKFRKKNKTTDVLSFPFYRDKELKKKIKTEKNIYLGDVIINFYKVNKKNNEKDFKKEFNKLWIHGFLHLLGHKHYTNKDFNKMSKVEKKIFNKIHKNNVKIF